MGFEILRQLTELHMILNPAAITEPLTLARPADMRSLGIKL